MTEPGDRARRDERTVEIVLAVFLGVGVFLGLVVLGWALDKALAAMVSVSLAPFAPGLVVAATMLGLGVMVRHTLRARRRGL